VLRPGRVESHSAAAITGNKPKAIPVLKSFCIYGVVDEMFFIGFGVPYRFLFMLFSIGFDAKQQYRCGYRDRRIGSYENAEANREG